MPQQRTLKEASEEAERRLLQRQLAALQQAAQEQQKAETGPSFLDMLEPRTLGSFLTSKQGLEALSEADALRIGGAALGGGLGLATGGPAGGIAGAIAGGVGGEVAQRAVQGEPLLEDLGGVAATEVASEIAGVGALRGLKKGVKLMRDRFLSPEAKTAFETIAEIVPREKLDAVGPTAAQSTLSGLYDTIEVFIRTSPKAARQVMMFELATQKEIMAGAVKLADRYSSLTDPSRLGKAFGQVLDERFDEAVGLPAQMRQEVLRLAKENHVIPAKKRLIEFASDVMDDNGNPFIMTTEEVLSKERPGLAVPVGNMAKKLADILPNLRTAASEMGDTRLHTILGDLNKPDFALDLDTAFFLSRNIKQIGRDLAARKERRTVRTRAIGIAAREIDAAIGKGLRAADPKMFRMWKQSNQLFAEAYDKFRTPFLENIIQKALDTEAPEDVLNVVRQGSVSRMKRLSRALEGSPHKDLLKAFIYKDLFQNATATEPLGRFIDPKRLEALAFGVGGGEIGFSRQGYTKEVLDEVLGKAEVKSLQNLIKTLRLTQSRLGSSNLALAFQHMRASFMGGALQAVGTINPVQFSANVAAMAVPGQAAKLYLSPQGRRMLTLYWRLDPRSERAAALLARMGALIAGTDEVFSGVFGKAFPLNDHGDAGVEPAPSHRASSASLLREYFTSLQQDR